MTLTEIISIILGILGIAGIVFTIYERFRMPDINAEKTDSLIQQSATLLNQSYERRFNEISEDIKELTKNTDNHINTIEIEIKGLASQISTMNQAIGRIEGVLSVWKIGG